VFTGIVGEMGTIEAISATPDGARLRLSAPATAPDCAIGDSVAIDGCCLTATHVADGRIALHAVPETLRRSTLGGLAPGADVNLEPALRAGEPLGGHYVQGHVDGVGRVRSLEAEHDSRRLTIDAPPELLRYCVEKGSIAVDGVALTITGLTDESFEVALVQHTREVTTLGALEPGDEVNVEVDVLAKYVERLARPH
jgi:riboflavin synthase